VPCLNASERAAQCSSHDQACRLNYKNTDWAFKPDADGSGGIWSLRIQANSDAPQLIKTSVALHVCPPWGCWPKAPPPPPPPPEDQVSAWSDPDTWKHNGTSLNNHVANPHNVIDIREFGESQLDVKLKHQETWSAEIPSADENVWIPEWKKVILDQVCNCTHVQAQLCISFDIWLSCTLFVSKRDLKASLTLSHSSCVCVCARARVFYHRHGNKSTRETAPGRRHSHLCIYERCIFLCRPRRPFSPPLPLPSHSLSLSLSFSPHRPHRYWDMWWSTAR
jgi:hypothetical protein